LTAGGVDCWGLNTNGQLGINTTTDSSTPVPVFAVGSTSNASLLSGLASVSTGGDHSCAVLTAGGVDCWGRNSYGQLGDNTTTQRSTPVAVIAAPPTLPAVTSIASRSATVSWTASSSALTYTVTATDVTTPANGGQTCRSASVSCTVQGLTNGDTYTFAATAYNGFLTSAAPTSTDGSVITGVPDAPTSLVATAGDSSASIAFSAGGDGGFTITSYEYTTDDGAHWTGVSSGGTSSPSTITGLTNGTPYSIKLRAYNAAGGGTPSDAVLVTPYTTPSAPTYLVATPGSGSVSIAFTPGAAGDFGITKYQYTTNNGTSWTDVTSGGTSSPVTISGLTNYTNYSIKLRAYSTGGGTASTAVSVTTKNAAPAITTAYSARMSGVAARGIYVAFTGVTSPGATMVSYRVNAYAKGTNTIISTCLVAPTWRACFLNGVTTGTEYDLRMVGYLKLTGSPLLTRATYESVIRTVRV
jgi:hypothetical protein